MTLTSIKDLELGNILNLAAYANKVMQQYVINAVKGITDTRLSYPNILLNDGCLEEFTLATAASVYINNLNAGHSC